MITPMGEGAGQQRSGASQVPVGPEDAGQRIDNFLMRHLRRVPRSIIYRILRRGEVRVNKGRVKPGYRVEAGDVVRIPPLRLPGDGGGPDPGAAPAGRRLAERVVYEDRALLVVDKPAGMAVHGGSGVSFGVIEALRGARPDAPSLELVHRLDRDTSGLLVLAKRRSALRRLHEALRAGQVDKTYLALVRGHWAGGEHRVDAPLRRNLLRSGERVVRVAADGQDALSVFTPLAAGPEASLVRVELITGRTHQIRVHGAHVGHPLAGDEKYGDAGFNAWLRERGLGRLFLHAWRLALPDPEAPGGRRLLSAPLDADLLRPLERLGLTVEGLE